MGDIYAREILGIAKPRVGVHSNGSEESKGNNLTREAARLCAMLDLNYIGYVEGFDLFNGFSAVRTDLIGDRKAGKPRSTYDDEGSFSLTF